jgi:hypothetical protein
MAEDDHAVGESKLANGLAGNKAPPPLVQLASMFRAINLLSREERFAFLLSLEKKSRWP